MTKDVVLILLYNSDKQVLLKRRTHDTSKNLGYWAFFGGYIEEKETKEITVRRTAWEKLHYPLLVPQLVMTQISSGGQRRKYLFTEEYGSSEPIAVAKGQEFNWFDFDEIKKLKISTSDRRLLEHVEKVLLGK